MRGKPVCVPALLTAWAAVTFFWTLLVVGRSETDASLGAVRVNETDTFGDDEERDEYFDFEDISEI